ncbi:sulfatase-like hydrolase/transferase [Xanthomonas sp. NCPPB 2632]|uniref:sulfatase-like hydrolase/transferase n=1 Tax=Xanthomonas sp. NCPPB 2632 TaxID=3240912 RepID=UPI00351737C4
MSLEVQRKPSHYSKPGGRRVYEGGFRVPMLARWPGVIEPGVIINETMSAEDWMPTLVAAAGEPHLKEMLLTGYEASGSVDPP